MKIVKENAKYDHNNDSIILGNGDIAKLTNLGPENLRDVGNYVISCSATINGVPVDDDQTIIELQMLNNSLVD